jgi:hypothetical protein
MVVVTTASLVIDIRKAQHVLLLLLMSAQAGGGAIGVYNVLWEEVGEGTNKLVAVLGFAVAMNLWGISRDWQQDQVNNSWHQGLATRPWSITTSYSPSGLRRCNGSI